MAKSLRHDGRRANELRPAVITPHYVPTAMGSCLIQVGQTRVICTASLERGVPDWLVGAGKGWLTAEYGMLPASTPQRKKRPIAKPDGRAAEIQRLIGRCLRGAVDTSRLGENTLYLDCDVLTADGGTRTAAITGAYVALALAAARGVRQGLFQAGVLGKPVAAVSVGVVDGRALLDLDYREDVAAEVDMNVAMTSGGRFIEVQATGERDCFSQPQLQAMLALARQGIGRLLAVQRQAIAQVSHGEHRENRGRQGKSE